MKLIALLLLSMLAWAEDAKSHEPSTESLLAKIAHLEALNTSLQLQIRREMLACWSIDIIPATYEAAQAAKKAEALKPAEPKKAPDPKK